MSLLLEATLAHAIIVAFCSASGLPADQEEGGGHRRQLHECLACLTKSMGAARLSKCVSSQVTPVEPR